MKKIICLLIMLFLFPHFVQGDGGDENKDSEFVGTDHEYNKYYGETLSFETVELIDARKSPLHKLVESPSPYEYDNEELVATAPKTTSPPEHTGYCYSDILSEPLEVDFFATLLNVHIDPNYRIQLDGANSKALKRAWTSLNESETYTTFISQTEDYKKKYNLSDWGYTMLLYKVANTLFPNNNFKNERLVFTWFMLNNARIETLIGIYKNELYLLLTTNSDIEIYNTKYVKKEDGQIYYLHNFDDPQVKSPISAKKIAVPVQTYVRADRNITSFSQRPRLNSHYSDVMIYTPDGTYTIPINTSSLAYWNEVPTVSAAEYFRMAMDYKTLTALEHELMVPMYGLSKREKINYLLKFVQDFSHYEADYQPLSPEQTLTSSKSDCEDRSALFAQLANHILGLEVIGLDYGTHINTAVYDKRCSKEKNLTFVKHANKCYVVCDPTYRGYTYGQINKKYKDKTAKVIDF